MKPSHNQRFFIDSRKIILNIIFILAIAMQIVSVNATHNDGLTFPTYDSAHSGENSSSGSSDMRFIPVELFTGAKWDGRHELKLQEISTSTCASANGKACDNYDISGPFNIANYKTGSPPKKESNTEAQNINIQWAGDEVSYYRRTFNIPSRGEVESFFIINKSKDGLVRIFDKRQQWGVRTYSGIGSKFPLGYWRKGEVRTYDTRRSIKIEIIELFGPDDCLTFRWVLGEGKRRNTDNNYTYCPNRGLTKINSNITHNFNDKEG